MSVRRWHRPRVFALLLTLFGVAFFLALGSWQWRRGQEKAELFAAFDRGFAQAPVALEQARRAADRVTYPHVVVHGSYVEPDVEYELENQVRGARVGVMAFALFQPAGGGDPLLVNRGFLPYSSGDRRYPALPPLPRGETTLSGLYAPPPGAGLRLGGNGLAQQKYPKKVIYLDLAEIAADLDRRLDPRVLLLLPQPGAAEATPFVREWRPEVFPPERHYGYALTWFTFAAVVVATFAILHWRKTSP